MVSLFGRGFESLQLHSIIYYKKSLSFSGFFLFTQKKRNMITAKDIIDTMRGMENEKQREILQRFFKTGKGEYGEGDSFLGLKVPQTRLVVKEARLSMTLSEIEKLLYSEWHEVRLCGFLLLVEEMKAALPKRNGTGQPDRRKEIADFYLLHARQANNWDLVDLSCSYIIGTFLLHPLPDGTMPDRNILDTLSASSNLWEQRISIVSTAALIREGQFGDTLRIAKKLLYHPHDLIHKATGWMLREVGKRNIEVLRGFLSEHHETMPRTTLRYAIEKMEPEERRMWMTNTPHSKNNKFLS